MVTKIKLALAIVGIILFATGVRLDHTVLRWIGIAFVAAAFLTRFYKTRA